MKFQFFTAPMEINLRVEGPWDALAPQADWSLSKRAAWSTNLAILTATVLPHPEKKVTAAAATIISQAQAPFPVVSRPEATQLSPARGALSAHLQALAMPAKPNLADARLPAWAQKKRAPSAPLPTPTRTLIGRVAMTRPLTAEQAHFQPERMPDETASPKPGPYRPERPRDIQTILRGI